MLMNVLSALLLVQLPLMTWEKQWRMVQGFEPLPFMWKTQMTLLAVGWLSLGHYKHRGGELTDRRFLNPGHISSPDITLTFKLNE